MLLQMALVDRVQALSPVYILKELIKDLGLIHFHLDEALSLFRVELVLLDCLNHVVNALCSLVRVVVQGLLTFD